MPYEFSIFLFRDDAISPRNVFQAFEDIWLDSETKSATPRALSDVSLTR
jgi:hypothetical protein